MTTKTKTYHWRKADGKFKKNPSKMAAIVLLLTIIFLCGNIINQQVSEWPKPKVESKQVVLQEKKIEVYEVNKGELRTVTAYSEFDSCHYPGCVMASGKPAYVGAVACPRNLKLGTKVYIEEIGVLTCEDRTHIKYDGRFDVFMGYNDTAYYKAVNFGKKQLRVIYL